MSKSKTSQLAAAVTIVTVAVTLLLSSCPLPFEFSPRGTAGGGGGSDDPANPAVTAAPTCVIVSKVTGEVLTVIDTDALVLLDSETRNSVIYYQIIDPSDLADPPTPQPGHPDTKIYDPSQPPELSGHLASFAFVAMAIGPNMYPSVLMCGEVQVLYTMAATPVFSALSTSWPPSATITSPDPGAIIYYEQVTGPGPAPDPVPGVSPVYTNPIVLSGLDPEVSFSAVAVVDQKENSFVGHVTYDPTSTIPSVAIDDGDGLINIQEDSVGVSVRIDGAIDPDAIVSYSVVLADNCSVSPATGSLDGSPVVLTLMDTSDGPVAVAIEFSDEYGNKVTQSDSSVADLTVPATPTLLARSNGIAIDAGGTRTIENRTLFADNIRYTATSGGGGGGGWHYRYKRGAAAWSGWVSSAPTNVPIYAIVSSGSVGDLEVEFRESDLAGNRSIPANVLATVDRRPAAYDVELWRSGAFDIDANTRLTVLNRDGGVGFNIHLEIRYGGDLETVFDGPVYLPIGTSIWSNTWSKASIAGWEANWSGFYEFDSYGNPSFP